MSFTEKELSTLTMLVKTEIAEVVDLINTSADESDKKELTDHLAIMNEIYKKLQNF